MEDNTSAFSRLSTTSMNLHREEHRFQEPIREGVRAFIMSRRGARTGYAARMLHIKSPALLVISLALVLAFGAGTSPLWFLETPFLVMEVHRWGFITT